MARFVINEFHTATIFQWQSCSFRHYVTGTVCQRLRGREEGERRETLRAQSNYRASLFVVYYQMRR